MMASQEMTLHLSARQNKVKKDQFCESIPEVSSNRWLTNNLLNKGSEKLKVNHDKALFYCFRRSLRDDETVALPPVRRGRHKLL